MAMRQTRFTSEPEGGFGASEGDYLLQCRDGQQMLDG